MLSEDVNEAYLAPKVSARKAGTAEVRYWTDHDMGPDTYLHAGRADITGEAVWVGGRTSRT